MRTQKSIKNISVDLLITILLVVIAFISRKVFIEYMGANTTGLMLLFTQLIGVLNLAELGVATATASLLYREISKGNTDRVSIIISNTKRIYDKIFIFFIILGFFLGLGVFSTIDNVSNIEYSFWYWMLFVLNTSISFKFSHYSILLIANQKYYKSRCIQGSCKIITSIIQILSIVILKNFFIYILIETAFNIIQWYLFRKCSKREYSYINFNNKTHDNSIKEKISKVFFHKVGGVLVFNTDYIIISKFLTLPIVTAYASYLMIFQAFTMLTNILVNSLTASVGDFLHKKTTTEKYALWNQLRALFFYFSTVISITTLLTINSFISLWIGEDYVQNKETTLLLIFNLYILLSRPAVDIFKNASGHFNDTLLPILEGIINITISLLLVSRYGLNGVIIGTCVSNILIIVIAKPYYLFKKIFPEKSGVLMIVNQAKYFIYTAIIALIINELSSYINISNFIEWLGFSILLIILISAVSFFIFLFDNDFRKILSRLYSTVKNKNDRINNNSNI